MGGKLVAGHPLLPWRVDGVNLSHVVPPPGPDRHVALAVEATSFVALLGDLVLQRPTDARHESRPVD
jgi:hypothetical protein